MKNSCRIHVKGERGIVLILSLLMLTVLSIMAMGILTMAIRENQVATNYRNHTAAFFAAEAGTESGVADLKVLLAGNPNPTQFNLDGIAPRPMTSPLYTFTNFTVERISDFSVPSSVTQGVYAGLAADTTEYMITAEVAGPRGSRSRQSRVVRYLEIPLFQFGVFYGRGVDLEIAPGPPMAFNGRVHANGDMYLRNDSMSFDAGMTSAGSIYRYLKRDPNDRGTNPNIMGADGLYHALNFDHDTDVGFGSAWTPTDWATEVWNVFGGKIQDSAMGVAEIVPPIPAAFYDPADAPGSSHLMIERGAVGDTQALKDAKLYYQADLRIENGNAFAKDGSPVDLSGCPGAIANASFYDGREQADVATVDVDIAALQACGKMPTNGILYVYQDPVAGDMGVVRLKNGDVLNSGLTIATDNPLYVQGDYNKAGTVSASILADAVTVLSGSWDDALGTDVTSARPATATEIHAAFALGPNAESVNGQGNGQLENVIRFLENWSGQDFTYVGSIVALWHSQQATADWRCCGDSGINYYNPPNRLWSYDAQFSTNPPPGTPMGIYVGKGRWTEGG